ncbi:2-keto-4-pentenoate hydratase [Kineococcus sp. LSe6-4]|uniref:2-keto-4-pentenoate hydratase n=1 Tax=Kineococcus halophytocola TaxID=3234027 RepID=A0ABV4GYJ0_9ACTN
MPQEVDRPDYGTLFSDSGHPSGARLPLGGFLQPRVEAEVAFVLDRDVTTAVDAGSVAAHVRAVLPALEIVDSRIEDWDITFVDTVADNASFGAAVLGPARPLDDLDLTAVRMTMTRDGAEVSTGRGSDCLGSPLAALAWLAGTAIDLGDPLRAGEVVLSGALGPVVAARAGDVFRAVVTGVGDVEVTFAGGGAA